MSKKHAYVYFYVTSFGKIHQIHDSDIFRSEIRIPDKIIPCPNPEGLRVKLYLTVIPADPKFRTSSLSKDIYSKKMLWKKECVTEIL